MARRPVKDMGEKQRKAVMAKLKDGGNPEKIGQEKKEFIMNATKIAILPSDVYLCYSIARSLYSSWDEISDAKALRKGIYDFVGEGVKTGLIKYQTDYIWKIIEDVTEEEISLVENALKYF